MKTKLIYTAAALTLMLATAFGHTATTKPVVKTMLIEQANGDYRLFIFATNRGLVCEEKPIQIVAQGDAVNPVVLECKH